MKTFYKASRVTFLAELVSMLASLIVFFGITCFLAAAGVKIASETNAAFTKGYGCLNLTCSILTFALAMTWSLILWLGIGNPGNFPSCFCYCVILDADSIKFALFPGGSLTVVRNKAQTSPSRFGFWVKWHDEGKERQILIRRNVFKGNFSDLQQSLSPTP